MPLKLVIVSVALAILSASGCKKAPPQAPVRTTDFKSAMAVINEWTASLKTVQISEVKAQFAPSEPKETTWVREGKQEPKLEYSFEKYDVEFYFANDRLTMVSIDLFP